MRACVVVPAVKVKAAGRGRRDAAETRPDAATPTPDSAAERGQQQQHAAAMDVVHTMLITIMDAFIGYSAACLCHGESVCVRVCV